MKIQIISNIDNGKGLERDYRILAALLESWGHDVEGVHYQRADRPGPADLALFLEVYEPRLADRAARRWLIPNAEWWQKDVSALGDFELVLCKTRDALSCLLPFAPRARHVGFMSADHYDASVPRTRRFLHVPGGSTAKGTDSVLLAWERHRIPYPLTVVSSLGWSRRARNVELVGRIDERRLRWHQNAFQFHLCPSRYEGWGHSIHEGLSVGSAVVVPDTPAMRDVDGCALRIPARPDGTQGLAGTHAVSPEDLRDAVERCTAFTDADLRRIELAARDAYLTEREAFIANLWELLGERPSTHHRTLAVSAPRERAPQIAIVIAAGASEAPLLRRSVLALRAQSAAPSSFEVVVACDGGDPRGEIRSAVEAEAQPFRVTLVYSERPHGDTPHPSHANNAGWRATSAPWIWFVEANCMLGPEAVQHALDQLCAAEGRGLPAVLVPVPARVALSPDAWLERSSAWAKSGAPEDFVSLLEAAPVDGRTDSGPDPFRRGAPSSERLPELADGVPLVQRDLVDVLGGFDEWFVGWSAERGAFIDLLQGVQRAGLIELRLLTSARAFHQPRAIDPEARLPALRRGQDERQRRAEEIGHGARWWRERLHAVRARLPPVDRDPLRIARAVRTFGAPALRGLYGGVIVVGHGAAIIAQDIERTCGLAARVVSPAQLADLPTHYACGAILTGDAASGSLIEQARRIVKPTNPLVIAEVADESHIDVRVEYVGAS